MLERTRKHFRIWHSRKKKRSLEISRIHKTKGKRKHVPVELFSMKVEMSNSDTDIHLCWNWIISKWRAVSESQVSQCLSGSLQITKGRRPKDPCGNELELERSVWTYVSLNTGKEGYIQKYLQIYEYIGVSTHTYISLLCQQSRHRRNS